MGVAAVRAGATPLLSLLLDLSLGDPPNHYHPVAWMGTAIARAEGRAPKRGRGARFGYGAAVTMGGALAVAALGIAAHEVGHVVQHQRSYVPLMFRNGFFPAANIGSNMAIPLFIIGMLFASPMLMNIGIFAFAFAVVFHIITLPVEFDASGRAIKLLEKGSYLDEKGLAGAKAVLSAAALSYLAATAMAILQLIRLLILRGRND